MSIFRGIFILVVFFIGLYILRDNSSPTGSVVQSGYVNPFVKFFNDIESSVENLPGLLKNDNPQNFNMLGSGVQNIDLPKENNMTSGTSSNSTTDSSSRGSINNNQSSTSTGTVEAANINVTHKPVIVIKNPVKKKVVVNNSTSSVSNLNQNTVSIPDSGDTSSELSLEGVFKYTNIERQKGGLKPLVINQSLSASAVDKLQDILQNQYFEHISPSGVGVSDLAKKEGYNYVVIGENLALGTFGSNKALLAAWMASPGHRANIMDPRYQDIGIAVGRGMFQGSMQWVAVQHFGKPISACVSLNPNLKVTIDSNHAYLIELEKKIVALKNQIDTLTGSAYREKAEEYNDSVKDYNVRLMSLQSDVAKYNSIATEFNACIGTAPAK